ATCLASRSMLLHNPHDGFYRDGCCNTASRSMLLHNPMTGFYRDGCCNTGQEDIGNHTVCAVMTAAFLNFSKSARCPFPRGRDGHASRSTSCRPACATSQMRKFVIFMMVLTDLGFLVGAASARVIILKGTHTRGQVEIACTKGGGVSTAGRGHGGFGCR